MTHEEKAKELVDKFRNEYKWVETDYRIDLYRDAKQCALVCVDEILATTYMAVNKYWQQVKQSIEKM